MIVKYGYLKEIHVITKNNLLLLWMGASAQDRKSEFFYVTSNRFLLQDKINSSASAPPLPSFDITVL